MGCRRFTNELSALTPVFTTLDLSSQALATEEEDRMRWRGVRNDDGSREPITKAKQRVLKKNDFNIETLEKYLKAA